MLIVSGIVNIKRYPRDAAIYAKPIPVLPLVGSMITVSGFNLPSRSAASSINKAALSFALDIGLNDSNFAYMLASPVFIRLIFNSGVCPIKSVMFSAYFIIRPLKIKSGRQHQSAAFTLSTGRFNNFRPQFQSTPEDAGKPGIFPVPHLLHTQNRSCGNAISFCFRV